MNNYNFHGGIQTLMDTDESMGSGGVERIQGCSIGGTTLSVEKLEDQTLSNSTTFVPDNHLKFWVGSVEKVRFRGTIEYTGPPASDLKFKLVSPEGSTCKYVPEGGMRLNNGNNVVFSGVVDSGGVISVGSTDSTHRIVTFMGYVHNGSTPGWVQVEWAQKTASPDPSVVYSGMSCLELTRVVK